MGYKTRFSFSVGFVLSQLCEKIFRVTSLLLNLSCTIVNAKTEGIFAPELSITLHPSIILDLSLEYVWVCAKGAEKPWHMS